MRKKNGVKKKNEKRMGSKKNGVRSCFLTLNFSNSQKARPDQILVNAAIVLHRRKPRVTVYNTAQNGQIFLVLCLTKEGFLDRLVRLQKQ